MSSSKSKGPIYDKSSETMNKFICTEICVNDENDAPISREVAFKNMNIKPDFTNFPKSSTLEKLKAFLPEIKRSNKELIERHNLNSSSQQQPMVEILYANDNGFVEESCIPIASDAKQKQSSFNDRFSAALNDNTDSDSEYCSSSNDSNDENEDDKNINSHLNCFNHILTNSKGIATECQELTELDQKEITGKIKNDIEAEMQKVLDGKPIAVDCATTNMNEKCGPEQSERKIDGVIMNIYGGVYRASRKPSNQQCITEENIIIPDKKTINKRH